MPDREGKRVPDHRSDVLTGSHPLGSSYPESSSGVPELYKKYIRGSSAGGGGSGGGSGATRLSTYACARASIVT